MSGLVESSADARSKTVGQNFRCRAGVTIRYSASDYSTIDAFNYLNVSSITLASSEGRQYQVNFETDLPTANYVCLTTGGRLWNGGSLNMSVLVQGHQMTKTASACQFGNLYANTGSESMSVLNAAFFA